MLAVAVWSLALASAQEYASLPEAEKLAQLKSIGIITERSDFIDGNSIDPMRLLGPIKVVGSPALGVILGQSGASLDVTEFSGSFYVLDNVHVIARNADLAVRGGNVAIDNGRLRRGVPLEARGMIVLTRKDGGTASRSIEGLFETLHLDGGIAALSGRRMVINNREIIVNEALGSMNVWMSSDNVYVRGQHMLDRIRVLRDGIIELELAPAPWVSEEGYGQFRPFGVFDSSIANGIVGPNTRLRRYVNGEAQESVAATTTMGSAVDEGFCRSLPNCVIHAPNALGIRASKGQVLVTELASKSIALDMMQDGFGLVPSIQIEGRDEDGEEFSLLVDYGVARIRGPGVRSLTATILGPHNDGFSIREGLMFRRCAGCESERMVGSVR